VYTGQRTLRHISFGVHLGGLPTDFNAITEIKNVVGGTLHSPIRQGIRQLYLILRGALWHPQQSVITMCMMWQQTISKTCHVPRSSRAGGILSDASIQIVWRQIRSPNNCGHVLTLRYGFSKKQDAIKVNCGLQCCKTQAQSTAAYVVQTCHTS
jgi:hypothetical protein